MWLNDYDLEKKIGNHNFYFFSHIQILNFNYIKNLIAIF